MARKPNYEFERRERDRLKQIKNAEKAAAKKEAKAARTAGRADADDSSGPAASPADHWAEPGVSRPGSEEWSVGAEPAPLLEAVGAETPY